MRAHLQRLLPCSLLEQDLSPPAASSAPSWPRVHPAPCSSLNPWGLRSRSEAAHVMPGPLHGPAQAEGRLDGAGTWSRS